ncbi:MAG: hypothetical protein HY021_12095, partial [Burkholderiales bacterium]|nr:hypothetical protein [Burkholderiales bacterium]
MSRSRASRSPPTPASAAHDGQPSGTDTFTSDSVGEGSGGQVLAGTTTLLGQSGSPGQQAAGGQTGGAANLQNKAGGSIPVTQTKTDLVKQGSENFHVDTLTDKEGPPLGSDGT